MPKLSALIHTNDDAERIGTLIDALTCCNDVLVIDDNSEDETQSVARRKGARLKKAIPGVTAGAFAMDAYHDWILVVRPDEMPSPQLIGELDAWRARQKRDEEAGYLINVRNDDGSTSPQMRLVNRRKINWTGELPPTNTVAPRLNGELLKATVIDKAA